jgi:UDP-N-acetylglucosamine diphosphorylase/glucosamine-1-phosphate N-acetyltransferase
MTRKGESRRRFAAESAESAASRPVAPALPLVIYDDAVARRFEPFALTRPIGTLTSGVAPIFQRWSMALQVRTAGCIAAEHLMDFDEEPGVVTGIMPAGTIIANARFAPALEMISARGDGSTASKDVHAGSWICDGRVAAVRLTKAMPIAEFSQGGATLESFATGTTHVAQISGWWHDEIWDFIRHLGAALTDDIGRMQSLPVFQRRTDTWAPPSHTTILGDHPVFVWGRMDGEDAAIEAHIDPHVVLDASAGPILIESGAHIRSFTRISGPCRIGRHSTIVGGDVTGCSIGPVCKVRGEISSSAMLGFSNKGHDGFVGHSYLGRWVNLGAGTTTSNLKNTYGSVALWTLDGIRDSGLQFLGTMFGDHVKTGIGTMLTTGTVLGAASNVYGSAMPPKVVAPFSWGEGEPYDVYRLDKFLANAETVMGRRHMPLSDRAKRQLSASFERRWNIDGAIGAASTSPRAGRSRGPAR